MNSINKSSVMTRAWKIFRGNSEFSYSFSASLKRAWQVEKENASPKVEEVEVIIVQRSVEPVNRNDEAIHAAMFDYYHGAGSQGRYFGD